MKKSGIIKTRTGYVAGKSTNNDGVWYRPDVVSGRVGKFLKRIFPRLRSPWIHIAVTDTPMGQGVIERAVYANGEAIDVRVMGRKKTAKKAAKRRK